MIDERSLTRAMKESWRGGGYEVAGYGDGNGRMLFLDGRTWTALLPRRTCPRKGEEILRTNMVWKGQEVWQKENLRVLAFDAALTEIGFGEPLAYGNMLVWDDEGGMVFILPEANLIDETLERLLEQTPLV